MSLADKPINARPASVSDITGFSGAQEGLTLREYYAGLAMQGLLAKGFEGNETLLALCAVGTADALIKQLEKTDGQSNS